VIDPAKQLALLRSQLDPSQLFGELRRSAGSLTQVGTTVIDGVRTSEYRGVLPPATFWGIAAPFRSSSSEVPVLSAAQGSNWDYNRFLEQPVGFAVWVDREGVVRRVLVEHLAKGDVDTEFTFSDFNQSIPAVPIHAGQVFVLPRGAWNVTIGGSSD
jgi:hypothetical protein